MHCVWAPSPRSRRGPTGTCSSSRSSTTGQACPMRPSATCRPATTPAVLVGCGSPGVLPTTRRSTPPTQVPASGSSSTAERPHAVAFLCDDGIGTPSPHQQTRSRAQRGRECCPSLGEGADSSDLPADYEGLDGVSALVGVDGFDVGVVARDVIVEQQAVAAQQVTGVGEDPLSGRCG